MEKVLGHKAFISTMLRNLAVKGQGPFLVITYTLILALGSFGFNQYFTGKPNTIFYIAIALASIWFGLFFFAGIYDYVDSKYFQENREKKFAAEQNAIRLEIETEYPGTCASHVHSNWWQLVSIDTGMKIKRVKWPTQNVPN